MNGAFSAYSKPRLQLQILVTIQHHNHTLLDEWEILWAFCTDN